MNDDANPKLSRRSRLARSAYVVGCAGAIIWAEPTWSTAAVFFVLIAAWLSGTFVGFLLDEYFPGHQHSPKEWTSRPRHDGRRWFTFVDRRGPTR